MKKLILAAMAIVALASCSKTEPENLQIPQDGLAVSVKFDNGKFDTRAFFDNTAEAEPYEKAITSAIVYVFDSQGKAVMRKEFSTTEVQNLSANLILPESVAGEECTFYAMANNPNFHQTNITSADKLLDLYDTIGSYNSDFSAVTTSYIKEAGFTMSDIQKVVVQPKGTPTNVSFVMKRTVAKVAVKVSVDQTLAQQLGSGKVTVNSIRVSNIPMRASVFYGNPVFNSYPIDVLLTQKSVSVNGAFCNLFYVPERKPLTAEEWVSLRITATFDADGSDFTKDDQIPLEWDMSIDGTGDGELKRNGYYRVSAVICGLTDALEDIRSSIVVAEWETPVTQETVFLE